MSRAPTYTFVDDEGTLTGTAGSEVTMTVKEAVERAGLAHGTVSKRISRGARRWSNVALCPEQGKRNARQKFLMQTSAHFAEEGREYKERRAHQERVLRGHKDL